MTLSVYLPTRGSGSGAGEQRLGEAEDSSPGRKMRADTLVVAQLILLLDKLTLLL